MRFEFADTHVYPGSPAQLSGHGQIALPNALCQVEFSDGVVLSATCSVVADAVLLRVPAYATKRGTHIEAKGWMLKPDREAGGWKVAHQLLETPPM